MSMNPVHDARGRTYSICIVTPFAIGSNPRVVKEANALHDAGFRVSVVSTRMLDIVDRRDDAILERVKWKIHRIDLRSRFQWKARRIPQLMARYWFDKTGSLDSAIAALHPAVKLLTDAALENRADLYIAHYPAALPAVFAAASHHRSVYAYDAEDFHLGEWSESQSRDVERRLTRKIEDRYLPLAKHVTAASPLIAEAYAAEYGIAKPQVVLNTFPTQQRPHTFTTAGTVTPGPSLYWFSQTIGPDRGLECAVFAIATARVRPHLYLRGFVSPEYQDNLIRLAREVGAEGRVHFLPPAAPNDLERLAAKYDVGLCGEPGHTENNRRALSNKLFTYVLSGLPPVMSNTPAQAAFAASVGLVNQVYKIDNYIELAALLDNLLGNSERLAEARSKIWQLGTDRYNWEHDAKNLVTIVERSVRTNRPGLHGIVDMKVSRRHANTHDAAASGTGKSN